MKLLFDQNLSFKLCLRLKDLFPNSQQVRSLGMSNSDDKAIWQHSVANDFIIVTQDSDFADMAALLGSPPKVLWLRCGNQPTLRLKDSYASNLKLLKLLSTMRRRRALRYIEWHWIVYPHDSSSTSRSHSMQVHLILSPGASTPPAKSHNSSALQYSLRSMRR